MSTDNVDTKVVSLEFDNKQFEAGVKTSMSTLEKLKESLNFAKNADSLKGLQDSVKHFDTSHLSDSIQQVNASWSAMQTIGDQVLRNLTNSVMHFGTKMVHSITSSITQGGWSRALKIEQAKFQIEGLGYSYEKYSKAINDAVDGTAYGLDSAAKAASQLLASGVTDSNKMGRYLRGISGVAAMTGRDYDSIANIFTKIAGQGKVTANELNQLAASGINAAAAMAKQMGKTEKEIREDVHKSKISFAEFADAMNDAFGEHAKDANKTFTGALSNMKAALARIGAKVATPLLKNLTDLFNWLRVAINQANKALDPFINGLNKLQDVVTERLDVLITGSDRGRSLIHFKDQMKETFGKDTQSVMKDFEAELKNIVGEDNYKWWLKQSGTFEKALHNGMASADQISQAFANMADSEKYSSEEMQKQQLALRNMSKDATSIGSSLNRWLTDMGKISKYSALDRVLDSWRDLGYTYKNDILPALIDAGNARGVDVKKIIKDYGGIREAVRFGAIDAEVFKDAFTNLGKEGSNAAKALAWELSDTNSELGALVDRLDDRPTFYYIGEIISNIVSMLGKPIKMIVEAFHEVFSGSLFDSLNEILDWVSDITAEIQLSDELLAGIKSLIKGVLSIIKSAGGIIYRVLTLPMTIIKNLLKGFMSVFDAGTSLFSWFASGAGTVLQDLARWIDSFKIIEGITNIISDLFYRIGKLVGDIVLKIKGSEKFQKFVKSIKDSVWTIYNSIKNIFRAINLDTLFTILSGIGEVLGEIVEQLLNSTIVQRSIEIIAELIVRVADGISHATEAIKTFFDSIKTRFPTLSKMKDVGINMWQGLVNGFDASGVLDLIGGFFERLIDFVCDILGIHSPSLVFYTIGTLIVLGLANGILSGSSEITAAFKKIFNLSPSTIGAATEPIKYWFDEVLEVVSSLFQNFADHLKNIDIGSVIAGAGFIAGARFLWTLPETLIELTKPVKLFLSELDGIAKALKDTIRAFQNVFNEISKTIKASRVYFYSKLIYSLAALIFAITAAVYVFSSIDDPEVLKRSLIAMGIVIGLIAGLLLVVHLLASNKAGFEGSMKVLGMAAAFIGSLAFMLLLYIMTIRQIKNLSEDQIYAIWGVMAPLLILVGMVIFALWKGQLDKIPAAVESLGLVKDFINALSWFMIAIAVSMKLISRIDDDGVKKAAIVLASAVGGIIVLLLVLKLLKISPAEVVSIIGSIGSVALVLLALSAAVAILAWVANNVAIESAFVGLGLLAGLCVIMVVFYNALAELDKTMEADDAAHVAKSIFAVVGVILMLSIIMALLAYTVKFAGIDESLIGLFAITVFAVLLVAFWRVMEALAKTISTDAADILSIAKSLLPIAGAIGILALIAILLGYADWARAGKALLLLLPFMAETLLLILGLGAITKILKIDQMVRINITLLYAAALVALLAGMAILIGMLDPTNMKKGIIVIGLMSLFASALMFAFGYMSKAMTYDTDLGKARVTLLQILGVMLVLTAIVALCAYFIPNADAMVPAATAISIMVLAVVVMMTAILVLSKKVKRISWDKVDKLILHMFPLVLLLSALAVVLVFASTFATEEGATALFILSGVMYALVGVLMAIVAMSQVPINAKDLGILLLVFLGIEALLAGIVGIAILAGYVKEGAAETLDTLANVMLKLVVVCAVFAILGAFAGYVAVGGGVFAVVAGLITLVAIVLGWLDEITGIRATLTKGFEILEIIAEGIGKVIGIFFYGLGEGLSGDGKGLEWLTDLKNALEPFIKLVSGFSASDFEGITALADALDTMVDALYTSGLGGGDRIKEFIDDLEPLGQALNAFLSGLGENFDQKKVATAAESLGTLAEAYGTISGVKANSITEFTSTLPTMASNLKQFNDDVSKFETTEGLTNVLNTLTSLSQSLPTLTDIGNSKLNNFADSMGQLGDGLATFWEKAGGLDSSVDGSGAVKLAQTLVDMAQTLSGSGDMSGVGGGFFGFLGDLLSGGDLDDFSAGVEALGSALADFAEMAKKVPDDFNETKGKVAIAALGQLAELGKQYGYSIQIPYISDAEGTLDEKVKTLAAVVLTWAGALGELPDANIATLANAALIMGSFKDSVSKFPEDFPKSLTAQNLLKTKKLVEILKDFGTGLDDGDIAVIQGLGPALISLSAGLESFSKVDAKDVSDALNAMKAVDTGSIVSSASTMLSKLGGAISEEASKNNADVTNASKQLASQLSDQFGKYALTSLKTSTVATMSAFGSWFVASEVPKFSSAGSNAAAGFALGLSSNISSINAAVGNLSSAAITKLKELLDIHSPSRVMFGLGAYAGQGFVNGFVSLKNAVAIAAQNMGDTLVDSVNDTLSAIGSDLSPVISPVMDLSNVSRGTAAISNMLDQAMTNSALGNIGGITNAMYRNSSRASNDDVVAAVDALRGDISNLATNSTTINGVTLDNSGEVADAIETLARYATLERRS